MAQEPVPLADVARPEEWISVIYLGRRASLIRRYRRPVTVLVFGVSIVTCCVLAAFAGPHQISHAFRHLLWGFIPVIVGAHLLAYMGYVLAHHQVVNLSRARKVSWRRGAQVALIGFGGWLLSGGFAVDRHALESAGVDPTDANRSALALGLLELAVLSPAAWLSALFLLGDHDVSHSVTMPWVILVPLGFILSGAAAVRGPRGTAGITGRARRFLDDFSGCARVSFGLIRRPGEGVKVISGIGLYWASDIVALWASLRFVSINISLPRLILGYATGYVLTRRSLPFAGVVVIEALLILALWELGVPLGSASVAVLLYRVSDLGLTLGAALFASSAVERSLTFLGPEPVTALERQH